MIELENDNMFMSFIFKICFLCLSIGKYSKIMLLEIMKVASTLKLDFKHFLLIFKNILKSNLVFL